MIRNIAKRVLGLGGDTSGRAYDQTEGKDAGALGEYVARAADAQRVVRDFVAAGAPSPACISLGEACSTAWYLKQVGLKHASYPFDWVFCSPEIVASCLDDRFATFLDKRHIAPKPDGNSAGHTVYHDNLFNHRNPLKSAEDYAYHERCCERLLERLDSDADLMFVCTLINEPDKRPDWSSGFRHDFAMPGDHDTESCAPLFEKIMSLHGRSRFVVVEHLTDRTPRVDAERLDDRVLRIRFDSAGRSTGVYYPDMLDDFCAKLIYSGLAGKR